MAGTLQIVRGLADAVRDAADNFERIPAALERTRAAGDRLLAPLPPTSAGAGGGGGTVQPIRPRVRVNLDGSITPLPLAVGTSGGAGGPGGGSGVAPITAGIDILRQVTLRSNERIARATEDGNRNIVGAVDDVRRSIDAMRRERGDHQLLSRYPNGL